MFSQLSSGDRPRRKCSKIFKLINEIDKVDEPNHSHVRTFKSCSLLPGQSFKIKLGWNAINVVETRDQHGIALRQIVIGPGSRFVSVIVAVENRKCSRFVIRLHCVEGGDNL